jgi:hypothetical protein
VDLNPEEDTKPVEVMPNHKTALIAFRSHSALLALTHTARHCPLFVNLERDIEELLQMLSRKEVKLSLERSESHRRFPEYRI